MIYLGLFAFTIYQALPSQRDNPGLAHIRWAIVIANLANASWIFFWHYLLFPLSLLAMITLLAALLFVYLGLNIGKSNVTLVATVIHPR